MNPHGRAIILPAGYLPPHEPPGGEYPFIYTNGRTIYHFHTRTKTARARAATLSDIFEERGYLVLATCNKTHISVGTANLFGDLAGKFAPLKDCPKTLVYELARYRNTVAKECPHRVLDRQTSSQATILHPGLPSYEVLDEIVERYVEHSASLKDFTDAGFDPAVVIDVLRRIDEAEMTRRYAPPGIKDTSRAFDQDRRMPLTSSWHARQRD